MPCRSTAPASRGLGSFLAALSALLALPGAAERPRVVVVKSSDLAAYASVVAGFASEVRAEVVDLALDDSDAGKALKRAAEAEPALVLAVGPAAANGARKAFSDVPVVFCMVPYFEKYDLEGQNVTGIALTSDLSAELSALKALGAKRVGILEDPRYSAKVIEQASAAAGQRGMTVVPIEVDSAAKVDRALQAAKGRIDALLMIADKTVGNAAVVKRLIAFSQAEAVPLVGLSPSQVKEGALLSLSPSPIGIGQQAGRLANRIVHEKVDPGALAVAQPELLELALNLSTARKLGKSCDVAAQLLRFAAERGFQVRVYE